MACAKTWIATLSTDKSVSVMCRSYCSIDPRNFRISLYVYEYIKVKSYFFLWLIDSVRVDSYFKNV